MPDRHTPQLLRRRNAGAELRRQVVMAELARPRTQTELQRRLGMSRSGTLHLLRRMEAQGLVRAAERIGGIQIWERHAPQAEAPQAAREEAARGTASRRR